MKYEHQQHVRQMMITLPYFHYEVPVLYLHDGTPYIPVRVLCRMLGLRIETHLPKWRKLLLWESACKLPLYIPHVGTRLVWCLHFGALPLWYTTFHWKHLLPERHEQLRQASQELLLLPERMYLAMLAHYYSTRHFLFWFLTVYSDAQSFFKQLMIRLQPILDEQDREWLEDIMTQGRMLIIEARVVARKILQEQEKIPVIDAWHVNHYGDATETFSLPLLPLAAREEEEDFIECLEMLQEWFQELYSFLEERKHSDNQET